jgi:hypothetical protein
MDIFRCTLKHKDWGTVRGMSYYLVRAKVYNDIKITFGHGTGYRL